MSEGNLDNHKPGDKPIEMVMDLDWSKVDGGQDKSPEGTKKTDSGKSEATMDVDWSAVSEEIGTKIEDESSKLQKAREALGIKDTSDSASIVALKLEQEKAIQQISVATEKPEEVVEVAENSIESVMDEFGKYVEDAKAFYAYVKSSNPSMDDPEFVSRKDGLLSRGRSFYESDWSSFYEGAESNFKTGLGLQFNKLRTIVEDGLSEGSYVLGGVKYELKTPQDFAKTVQNIGFALGSVKSMFDYRNSLKQKK